MADTVVQAPTSTSSSSSNLAAHKETAVLALSFLVPPAAIALRQGKVDLESRHLAVSLVLYLSVVFYVPAIVHAYWLLYIRDNGGVEEWVGARRKQAEGLWNEHGGIVKAHVDQYSPMIVEKVEKVRNFTTEKVNYATAKKDEAVSYIKDTRAAAHELYDDAKEAYQAGTAIDWAKEKITVAVEKVKKMVESYPRVQALINYVEQRVPLLIEFLGKIYEAIRSKVTSAPSSSYSPSSSPFPSSLTSDDLPARMSDDESPSTTPTTPPRGDGDILAAIPRPDQPETEDNTVHSPRSNGTTDDQYETGEDATMDESFNEGTEEEYSQEL